MSRLDPAYIEHVTKFIFTAKSHRLSLKRELTICLCKSCKNLYAHGDNTVKSHLVRYGFVKDYTVWKFHGEIEDSSAFDGGRKSSSTTAKAAVNAEPQTSSVANDGHGSATTEHDYITMADLLQDMADGDEGYDDSDELVRYQETVELFESIANCLDDDDILFGSPRWLENFREMKQAAIDPLYKDCPKH